MLPLPRLGKRSASSFIDRKQSTNANSLAAEGLNEEQRQIQSIAQEFSRNELAPNMSTWDAKEEFPVATLKKAAELGFSGIYIKPENGGTGLGRIEASIVFEALSQGCVSTSAYLSIHKYTKWRFMTL
jgi:isobutyryl-CoA dehydrogenase